MITLSIADVLSVMTALLNYNISAKGFPTVYSNLIWVRCYYPSRQFIVCCKSSQKTIIKKFVGTYSDNIVRLWKATIWVPAWILLNTDSIARRHYLFWVRAPYFQLDSDLLTLLVFRMSYLPFSFGFLTLNGHSFLPIRACCKKITCVLWNISSF